MKLKVSLILISALLSGCSTVPIFLTSPTVAAVAPHVEKVPVAVQQEAAKEMAGGKCPAENKALDAALITIDEARAMKTGKPIK